MSIADIKPSQVPADLRVKIEYVMHQERLSWRATLIFLAAKVVSPSSAKNLAQYFSCPAGETTQRGKSAARSRKGVRA